MKWLIVGALAALLGVVPLAALSQPPKPAYVTGSPATGAIAKASGPQSVTTGDLAGDCTTPGSLTITCTMLNGVAPGYFFNGADASHLTGSLACARMPALTGDVTSSSGACSTTIGANKVTLGDIAQIGANTLVGNVTGSTANASALGLTDCHGATNALIYTAGTGFGCNTISGGGGGAAVHGTPTAGNCASWYDSTTLQDALTPCGGSFTVPPLTGWTWDVQGTSSFDTSSGSFIKMSAAQYTTGMRMIYRTLPSTPYTITAVFATPTSGTDIALDFGFRSATGQYVVLHLANASTLYAFKFSATNSPTAAYSSTPFAYVASPNYVTLRISDDGTNITLSYAFVPIYGTSTVWTVLYTGSRTNFLTGGPTGVAWGTYANSNGMTVYLGSWAVT